MTSAQPKRGSTRVLLAMLAISRVAVGSQTPEQEDPASARPAGVEAAAETLPRALSYGEITRELENRRRTLEDVLVSVGDDTATPEQREQLGALTAEIRELEAELERVEATNVAAPDDDSLSARWKRYQSAFRDLTTWNLRDGAFRFQIGIRAQLDATRGEQAAAIEESFGGIESGPTLRRGRVFAKGRMFRAVDFWLEYELGQDVGLKYAYVDGAQLNEWVTDRFRWRAGQFKEPFSIGRVTSSNYTGFMEIGLPADTFAPGRNVGLMLRHPEKNDRMTWAAAVTTNGKTTSDNPNNSDLTMTGRVTGLPVLEDGGRKLIHVGASVSDRNPTAGDIQYRARPEAHFAPFYADTGRIVSDDVRLYGFEVAAVAGPNWLQAEWIQSDVDADAVGDPTFSGAYLEVGRFLTGEHRAYDVSAGAFDRIAPNTAYGEGNPFRRSTANRGALEIMARYSTVDLTDAAISGGEMRNVSLGLNWYLNAESRLMLNYVRSEVRGAGESNLFLLRFQYNP